MEKTGVFSTYNSVDVEVEDDASKPSRPLLNLEGVTVPHVFELHKFRRRTYCAFCQKGLGVGLGVSVAEHRCKTCKFPVHSRCKDSALAEVNCEGSFYIINTLFIQHN